MPLLQWGLPILLTAIGLLLTGISLWFNWRKSKADRQDQIDLHFYDKRKEIFDAIMEFVAGAVRKGNVTREELSDFAKRTREAHHLFDAKIKDLCDRLYREGTNLMIGEYIQDKGIPTNPRESAEAWGKRMMWFSDLLSTLPKQFDPYLKVKK